MLDFTTFRYSIYHWFNEKILKRDPWLVPSVSGRILLAILFPLRFMVSFLTKVTGVETDWSSYSIKIFGTRVSLEALHYLFVEGGKWELIKHEDGLFSVKNLRHEIERMERKILLLEEALEKKKEDFIEEFKKENLETITVRANVSRLFSMQALDQVDMREYVFKTLVDKISKEIVKCVVIEKERRIEENLETFKASVSVIRPKGDTIKWYEPLERVQTGENQ